MRLLTRAGEVIAFPGAAFLILDPLTAPIIAGLVAIGILAVALIVVVSR